MGHGRIAWCARRTPLSRKASRLSLLAGFITAEAYLNFAVLIAHALTPASVFVFDPATGRHLRPGQIGAIGESFSWHGMIPLFIGTMLVFALTWSLVREAARQFAVTPARTNNILVRGIDAQNAGRPLVTD
jgi:hypothetical protein